MKREALKVIGLLAYVFVTLMVFQACFGPMYR